MMVKTNDMAFYFRAFDRSVSGSARSSSITRFVTVMITNWKNVACSYSVDKMERKEDKKDEATDKRKTSQRRK
jgi:ribosomal protein S2